MSCEDIFHVLINNFLIVFSKSYSREKFVTIWPGDMGETSRGCRGRLGTIQTFSGWKDPPYHPSDGTESTHYNSPPEHPGIILSPRVSPQNQAVSSNSHDDVLQKRVWVCSDLIFSYSDINNLRPYFSNNSVIKNDWLIQSRLKISNLAFDLFGYLCVNWIWGDIEPSPIEYLRRYSIKDIPWYSVDTKISNSAPGQVGYF